MRMFLEQASLLLPEVSSVTVQVERTKDESGEVRCVYQATATLRGEFSTIVHGSYSVTSKEEP